MDSTPLPRRVDPIGEFDCVVESRQRPIFRGTGESRQDHSCPECGEVVLQDFDLKCLVDISLKCGGCGTVLYTRERALGQPIPRGSNIFDTSPPPYDRTQEIGDDVMMIVSRRAVRDYEFEMGGRLAVDLNLFDTPERLRDLADKLQRLFGDRYARARQQHQRGVERGKSGYRSYLLFIIDQLRRHAGLLDLPAIARRDRSLSPEYLLIAQLLELSFRQFVNHPAFPELSRGLRYDTEFWHALAVLLSANGLYETGNAVGIMFGQQHKGRIPDLWIEHLRLSPTDIEVKAPQSLLFPKGALTGELMTAIMAGLIAGAGSTRGGQRRDDAESLVLVVNTFRLTAVALDALEKVTEWCLEKEHTRGRKRRLAFVILHNSRAEDVEGRRSMNTFREYKIVRHPGYEGELELGELDG